MVERTLILASPFRSPAQPRNKIVERQGIYAPVRTPSPSQLKVLDIPRPSTPKRPPLLHQSQLDRQNLLPTPLRTPVTPQSKPVEQIPYSYSLSTPITPVRTPSTPLRTPSPLIFSAPATPAPTPGPIATRKDRRTTVRVARVVECKCQQFKHKVVTREPQICIHPGQPLLQWAKRPIEKHVAISWEKIPINSAEATAISYTWGDFDRENMIVGHWHDDPSRAIAMNLGTEWDISELLDRLVELTTVKGAIWIDQLCVPQREDYVREIMPKIPDIFRAMQVAVLMPGGRCGCLEQLIKDAEAGKVKSDDIIEDLMNEKCHNKAGLSSYTNRMWTRQEFRYAQNLRLVWNNKKPAVCFQYKDLYTGKVDIAAISGYATAFFLQKLHEGFDLSDKSGYWLIKETADKFARDLIRDCYGLKEEKKELPLFFRLLLGKTIERCKDVDDHPMWEMTTSLRTFCRNMRGLAYGTHVASNPKDLVLSVWVDLPGYKMPADMKFFSAFELLEDAARKMEDTHHVTLSSHAPAGLFKQSPGGCWRPEVYLAKKNIREVRDLYSTLSEADSPIYLRNGKVPLQQFCVGAISRRSFPYKEMYGKFKIEKIGPILSNVIKNLDAIAETRLGNLWHEYQDRMAQLLAPTKSKKKGKTGAKKESEDNGGNLVDFLKEYYFFDNLCSQNLDEAAQVAWETLEEVDHYQIMYKITCYLLGLDPDFCKKRGLELVIAPAEPAVIGLSNRQSKPGSFFSRLVDADVLTVSTSPNRSRPDDLTMCMLETIKCGEASSDGIPEYKVTGSWVSCKKVGEKELGAIAIPRDIHSMKKEVMRIDGWLV